MSSENEWLKKIFRLLDDNKKYPKYQFERRADIYVNLFLPEVLKSEFNEEFDLIIPEFPLKYAEKTDHCSNMDYLAISKSAKLAVLIELKTDSNSLKLDQIDNYHSALTTENWFSNTIGRLRKCAAKNDEYTDSYNYLLSKFVVGDKTLSPEKLEVMYIAPDHVKTTIIENKYMFISFDTLWQTIKTTLIDGKHKPPP